MSKRLAGFYWIKPTELSQWQPGAWSAKLDKWKLLGRGGGVDKVSEVGPPCLRVIKGGKRE